MSLRAPIVAAALVALCIVTADANAQSALLIGIADYTASTLPTMAAPAAGREWPDLPGPVNDAQEFASALSRDHGFSRVTTLTDQSATRTAILQALERLADGAPLRSA